MSIGGFANHRRHRRLFQFFIQTQAGSLSNVTFPLPNSPTHSHAEPQIEHNREYPEQGAVVKDGLLPLGSFKSAGHIKQTRGIEPFVFIYIPWRGYTLAGSAEPSRRGESLALSLSSSARAYITGMDGIVRKGPL